MINKRLRFDTEKMSQKLPKMSNFFYTLLRTFIPISFFNISLRQTLWGILWAMGISMFMLIFLSWSAYDRMKEASNRIEAVSHTYRVRLKNKDLLLVLEAIETGQRGYLLTKQEQFLEPYANGRVRLKAVQRDFRLLIRDNREQIKRLDVLNYWILKKITVLEYNMERTKMGKAVDLVALNQSRNYMAHIRELSETIENIEKLLLIQRQEMQKKADGSSNLYVFMLSGVALAFLLVFFRLLYIELGRRIGLQQTLEHKLRELENTNAELEQFAYVASHDLQEPLRKIRTFGERLNVRQADALNEDGKMSLSKINQSARRMQQLIDDLLLFSRTANARERVFEAIDLNEMVQEVREELSETMVQKNAILHADALPTIQGIRFQVGQLFVNLLSNALKYSRNDTPPLVEIEYEQVMGQEIPNVGDLQRGNVFHRISFTDNGIGFDAAYSEKIFVIFQRLHNRSEYAGTGIGLALCRRVMTNHNGFIIAEAKPNHSGAIFHLYFPQ